jgi:hypothetical protein
MEQRARHRGLLMISLAFGTTTNRSVEQASPRERKKRKKITFFFYLHEASEGERKREGGE